MKRVISVATVGVILGLGGLVTPVWAACPADSVHSGTVCMDKYENSVWDLSAVPTRGQTKQRLIAAIRAGTATQAGLLGAGAVQRGLAPGDLATNGCPVTGNGCLDVYAVSIPGVTPSAHITWFQAAAAARNSGKRLPTNQEWQVAALGTPDPGAADDGSTTCVTNSAGPAATGSRSSCMSDVGAFDMVGNIQEWVADWGTLANGCTNWSAAFGDDRSCVGGPGFGYSNLPGALIRGGGWPAGTHVGVFALAAGADPSSPHLTIGFRCSR